LLRLPRHREEQLKRRNPVFDSRPDWIASLALAMTVKCNLRTSLVGLKPKAQSALLASTSAAVHRALAPQRLPCENRCRAMAGIDNMTDIVVTERA